MADLFSEIEIRLRKIIREEVANAISEAGQLSKKTGFPEILTAQETAELLKIDVQRVYELARRHKENGFPVIRIGERSLRFDKDELYVWIKREDK